MGELSPSQISTPPSRSLPANAHRSTQSAESSRDEFVRPCPVIAGPGHEPPGPIPGSSLPWNYRQNDMRRASHRMMDFLSGGDETIIPSKGRAGIRVSVKAREIAAGNFNP